VAEPEFGPLGVPMESPLPQVAIERLRGSGPERDQARSAALAQHRRRLLAEVDRVDSKASDLAPPRARIEEQANEGGIATVVEKTAFTRPKEGPNGVLAKQRDRLLRHPWRAHPGHRRGLGQSLLGEPVEEAFEGEVAIASGIGAPPRDLVGDERFYVLSADARGLGGQGSIVEEVAEVRDCVLIARRVLGARFSASHDSRNESSSAWKESGRGIEGAVDKGVLVRI
jgi:hypothetical protein